MSIPIGEVNSCVAGKTHAREDYDYFGLSVSVPVSVPDFMFFSQHVDFSK